MLGQLNDVSTSTARDLMGAVIGGRSCLEGVKEHVRWVMRSMVCVVGRE
jgi:hypothetical protein